MQSEVKSTSESAGGIVGRSRKHRGPDNAAKSLPDITRCAQVDGNSRCRQDVLDMEQNIGARSWHFRVNISLLSIYVVYN